MLASIRQFVEENDGWTSSEAYMQQKRKPCFHTIIHTFGSWKQSIEEAGYTSNPSHMKRRCLESVHAFLREKGDEATSKLYQKERRRPVLITIEKHLGSWEKACKEAKKKQPLSV